MEIEKGKRNLMSKQIIDRCSHLVNQAKSFGETGNNYYFPKHMTQKLQKWISSVANIISLTVPPHSYFFKETEKIISDEHLNDNVPAHIIFRLSGILEGLIDEIESGFFKQLEYIFTALTFDDFLDHAEHFHKGGKLIESSILVSVVFEDTIRKIAKKNSIEESGVDLESIINNLVGINILTPVKAKRAKSNGSLRNKALHAQWNEFDLKDVGGLIKETRELIEHYL